MTSVPREGFLLLEDGKLFRGTAVAPGTCFGEVVFNTSMTGYQEILTDPSYRGQIVIMTQPHMGNYGVLEESSESRRPWVEGLLVRRMTERPSGTASDESLPQYLRRWQVPALEDLDTRAVVRHLRHHGSLRGVVTTERDDLESLAAELAEFPTMEGRALVDEVTCSEPWEWPEPPPRQRCHLAVYDFGVKANILRSLAERGARLTIVPARTSAESILELGVDGVVLSNGPGDPEPLTEVVENIRALIACDLPILGICLGHQLLGLALGGRTFKLKFGHHGGNQPVHDQHSGQVAITSQNHGFALDAASLPRQVEVSQRNLNDQTVEAFRVGDRPIYAVQYHPEAAPGPHDASELFDRFLARVVR
ncbi:MAG: glutamine-hydrolyzing carbamoyl-phosphate synthase small subunit [Acidobacteriota bacterium]